MYKSNLDSDQHPVCSFVPGFAFYDGIGNSLAEIIVDIFEGIFDLVGKIKFQAYLPTWTAKMLWNDGFWPELAS